MREFIISKKIENKNIYLAIQKEFPHVSPSALNKAFRLKDIKVNDQRVNKDYVVKLNDIVKVYIADNILFGIPKDIYYAYEDENILVAYKPKGIVSNHEKGPKSSSMLYFDEMVTKDKGIPCVICHRLDTNTEGLVIFAKNADAHKEILNAFSNNGINKEYITLVHGRLPKNKDFLSHYIVKNECTGFSRIYENKVNGSKTCITEYSVLEYLKAKNCSVVSIKLHTGRTHQIRAHMKHIGCHVIGDSKYSTNEINNKFGIHTQVLYAVKYTFNFDKNSTLNYLNNIVIDITPTVLDKIYTIINK